MKSRKGVRGLLGVVIGPLALLGIEWMIQAFAIGLAIATMRPIFVPALLLVADPSNGEIATLSVA